MDIYRRSLAVHFDRDRSSAFKVGFPLPPFFNPIERFSVLIEELRNNGDDIKERLFECFKMIGYFYPLEINGPIHAKVTFRMVLI